MEVLDECSLIMSLNDYQIFKQCTFTLSTFLLGFFPFILSPVFDMGWCSESNLKRSSNSIRLCFVFLTVEASEADLSLELLIKQFYCREEGNTVLYF